MSTASDEARVLRRRMDDLEAAVAAMARRGEDCGTAVLLKVQAAPAATHEFVSVKAVTVDGTEAEGSAVGLSETGSAFPAASMGTRKPPAGTHVVGRLIDGLWAIQYDGTEV